ncbi:MAG: GumC family protein [Woeseiaceae bacterium]
MDVERSGLQAYFALLRRRRSSMFIVFSTVAVATVFGTLLLDDQYRSTATIAIERPEIPENMVQTTVANYDTDLRIDRIRNQVLAQENVEAWISEFGLYEELIADRSINAAASQFRRDVEVITIQAREDIAVKDQGETIAFDLSYYGETPAKAVRVAERLADRFLEENRRSRNQSVEETLDFFRRDAQRLALKISDAEARLAEFKERNAGALPESANINAQMLDRAERDLDDANREIRDLRERRQILETDLAKESPNAPIFTASGETMLTGTDRLKLLQQQYVELSSKYGPEHPDIVRTLREINLLSGGSNEGEIETIREELDVAQRAYAAAQQRYSETHPDVRSLRNKIDFLQQRLTAISAAPPSPTNSQPDNPAYVSILVQIRGADSQIRAAQQKARELETRISDYESLLVQSPQVEREYLALDRNYNQAVAEYNEVIRKQTDAQRAQQLEVSEKGERYVLQRMPGEPQSAAFPNRLAIIILGIIFAVGCAFGAVVFSESLDPTVRGSRDLRNLVDMPPIAIIPVLESDAERQKRTMIWSSSALGVAAVIIYMIVIQVF